MAAQESQRRTHFESVDGEGGTFAKDGDLGHLKVDTPEQWQQDAFGQINAWLRALGLRRLQDRARLDARVGGRGARRDLQGVPVRRGCGYV